MKAAYIYLQPERPATSYHLQRMIDNYYRQIHDQLLSNPGQALIRWPDQPAEQIYTGRDILERVAAIRSALTREQVQPGQPVMLAMPVTFDLICTLLAIMAAGAIPVLPPAAASLRTLIGLLRKDKIGAVAVRQNPARLFAWLAKRAGITLIVTDAIPTETSSAWVMPQPVEAGQPALISHSSGSTGRAKSVRRSHRVLLAQHLALSQSFPSWPGQRDFPLFPNILLHNLALGTVSILPDLPGFVLTRMEPSRLVEQLIRQRVQTLTGNVYYFQNLLAYVAARPRTFPDVQALGIGGSPVPEPLVQALKKIFVQATIYVIYGSSEAEPIAVRRAEADPQHPRLGYAVGRVHPRLALQIRPVGLLTFADGVTCPVGEICVKGAHVATEGDDWFETGDFGYVDGQEQLFLTGRKGNEGVRQGVQHYQVEHVLAHVSGVERVAALATKREFMVYVQGQASKDELWQALTVFPPGLVTHIHFRKTLPVDTRHQSKIRYGQLR